MNGVAPPSVKREARGARRAAQLRPVEILRGAA